MRITRPTGFVTAGVLGCALALAAGAAAAMGHGLIAAAATLIVIALALAITTFARDPVRVLLWLWAAVIIAVPLSVIVGYDSVAGQRVRQLDEVLVLLLVLLALWRAFEVGTRIPLRYVLPALVVALCGALSAFVHEVPTTVALPGAWLGLKLWISIVIALLLPWTKEDMTRVYAALIWVGVAVAGLGFAEFITKGAILEPLRLTPEYTPFTFREGAVHSIFFHPQQFSLFMGILFAVAFARFAGTRDRSDLLFALLFAVAVLLSLRLKGVLSLSAIVLIVAFSQHWIGRRGGAGVAAIGCAVVASVAVLQWDVIRENVERYTATDTTARAQLYSTGVEIASDNAPLGVGFGRYASYPARINYSPVYDEYGLSAVYGLSRAEPAFLDDTSWPSVIGETGYAGLVAYVVGLAFVVTALVRRLRESSPEVRWIPLAALCVLAVILIDAIASPALFDWAPALTFALILGPALIATRPVARGADARPSSGRSGAWIG